ncbi:MAG: hypothetical protein ACXWC3_29790, partial [Burkholderiales bacterium]
MDDLKRQRIKAVIDRLEPEVGYWLVPEGTIRVSAALAVNFSARQTAARIGVHSTREHCERPLSPSCDQQPGSEELGAGARL